MDKYLVYIYFRLLLLVTPRKSKQCTTNLSYLDLKKYLPL